MLPDSKIRAYLFEIEQTVYDLPNAYIEKYEEEIIATNRFNLRIRIRMDDEFLLELNEAAVAEDGQLNHLGYRYHFQDINEQLLFRYDDTPHFPDIESFPHHKHLKNEIISSAKPDIQDVIKEALSLINIES